MREHHGWTRALDVQMELLKWHKTQDGIDFTAGYLMNLYTGIHRDKHEFTPTQILLMETLANEEAKLPIETLWRGDTCYITADMLHLIMQAAHDMPDDEIVVDFRNLMTPVGFVLLEEGIYGEDASNKVCGFHAMAWNALELKHNPHTEEMEKALEIYFFSDNFDEASENQFFVGNMQQCGYSIASHSILHTYRMFDGHLITHTVGPGYEMVEELLKVFYSIQLLSHQTIGKPVVMRPDRSTRKRFARTHPDEPERLITLITLRRKTTKKDDEEPKKVEWSRRWVVRGFWRKQWYPKTKTHDWKYIHEYIKGPEDKPLVITERRVFDFRR